MATAARHPSPWGPCRTCRASLQPRPRSGCPALHGARHATRVSIGEVDCTERYVSILSCGTYTYMFSRVEHYPHPSRHDPEPEPLYRWVVRAKQADGEFGEAVAAAPPNIQSMAVNAALQCVRGQLVALGGENRVSRTVANATALPLQWSSPEVAFTGDKAQTGCVEARARDSCEYDGKLSSVRLRGRTLVFTRSNLNSTGGRHVQVTRSTDGARGWSRFEQIRLAGYATRAHNNIYFWTARSVGGGKGVGRLLLATFPAVIEGKGGVYASVSHDGVSGPEPLADAVCCAASVAYDGSPMMATAMGPQTAAPEGATERTRSPSPSSTTPRYRPTRRATNARLCARRTTAKVGATRLCAHCLCECGAPQRHPCSSTTGRASHG